MSTTKIEWATKVWNPVTGCTPISEGCEHCYARRMAIRLRGRCGYPADEPFRVTFHPEKLEEPTRWKSSQRVFVCSMGDLFHEGISLKAISRIIEVMEWPEQHTYMILTKRPDRMLHFFEEYYPEKYMELIPNLWLGVTCENQARADERIPILLQIPAAKRFVSIEPMLGPVDNLLTFLLPPLTLPIESRIPRMLDWVILGGETGPGARPMHPDWARSVRDQCQAAGVPFFFKAWGDYIPAGCAFDRDNDAWSNAGYQWDEEKGGHILDGREWREIPE